MMTVHGAKGLEFHQVFIAGLGKYQTFSCHLNHLEEEIE